MTLLEGDCLQTLKTLADSSVDCCVTDPPYELGFMGKNWDSTGIAFNPDLWREVLRVLKPGGHLLAFSGTRTQHRMVCAIEDAGFEIRDQIGWVYGSGFPKSLDVSKAIDKAAGAVRQVVGQVVRGDVQKGKASGVTMAAAHANRNNKAIFGYGVEDLTAPATDDAKRWEGWGTALKPAWEPICVARKPFPGTVAENVITHGCGALNVDACRVEGEATHRIQGGASIGFKGSSPANGLLTGSSLGRWPANIIHDGSEEVTRLFPIVTSGQPCGVQAATNSNSLGKFAGGIAVTGFGDTGSAARFFYCAKAGGEEREDNQHPTVKPLALMRYLVRLVCPPRGTVLDPFGGSGTTGTAAIGEGFKAILCERDPAFCKLIKQRTTNLTPGLGL